MIEKIKKREASEKKRYKKYYNYDYHNKKNYTHVIDTTNLTIEEEVDELIKIIK